MNAVDACLDSRSVFNRDIRSAISRSEFMNAALEYLLVLDPSDLGVRDVRDDATDNAETFPLTFFAHFEMADSSLAAIAPMGPWTKDEELAEEEEKEEDERISLKEFSRDNTYVALFFIHEHEYFFQRLKGHSSPFNNFSHLSFSKSLHLALRVLRI